MATVSQSELLEKVHQRISKNSSASMMLNGRGVRIDRLGQFTFNVHGEPLFVLSDDFAVKARVRQRGGSGSGGGGIGGGGGTGSGNVGNATTGRLNMAQVSKQSGVDRTLVTRVVELVVQAATSAVQKGSGVRFSLLPVAEINIVRGVVDAQFTGDFVSKVRRSQREAMFAGAPGARGGGMGGVATAVAAFKPSARKRGGASGRAGSAAGGRRPGSARRGAGGSRTGGESPLSRNYEDGDDNATACSAISYGTVRSNTASNVRRVQQKQRERAQRQSVSGSSRTGRGSQKSGDARGMAAAAMASPGGDATAEAALIKRVKDRIMERGGAHGIRGISRVLKVMDDNGNNQLSMSEFNYGLRDYGIELRPQELERVFRYFDRDGNGSIDLNEFLRGMRGDMNERRLDLVRRAFGVLDKTGDGSVTIEDIEGVYDVSWHPEVREGKITPEQALRHFLSQFDTQEKDGIVTMDEFIDYYRDVSASVDGDDYFELMIRNAWHIPGGEGWSANTANKRVLVTNADGTQAVQTIEDDLGLRGDDRSGARRRLARQGVDAANVEMYGGVDTRDRPGGAKGGRGRVGKVKSAWLEEDDEAPAARASGAGAGGSVRGSARGSARARPSSRSSQRRGGRSSQTGSVSGEFDPYLKLRELLYSPPKTLEQLGKSLQVSMVSERPSISTAQLVNRLRSLDPSMTSAQVRILSSVVDPDNSALIAVEDLHELLTSRFGRDAESAKPKSILERVKAKIMQRAGHGGIRALTRILKIMDDDGNMQLSREELKSGMMDYGIELNMQELEHIFTAFDRDRNGSIDVDEFLRGMRGDMNERRLDLVRRAFAVLDKTGDGSVTIEDIEEVYDVSWHPDVQEGKITPEQALRQFLDKFDTQEKDGIVTMDEFIDYYRDVSASVDGDDYFELMIRNAWHIPGGEGWCANTANKRVLVTNADGTQAVQTIEDDLGLRGDDRSGARRRLARQGVDAANVEMYGGVDTREERGTSREGAARRMQAVFRGHKDRANVDRKKRQERARESARKEEEEEASRPRAPRVHRPKGRSYYGF